MRFSANVVAGFGSVSKLGDTLRELGFTKNILVICGQKSYEVAGRIVEKSLRKEDYNLRVLSGGIYPSVRRVHELLEKEAAGFANSSVIAVGGGRTIDVAKYMAKALGTKLAVVPTLLSSDAIASGFSVLWNGTKSRAVETVVPSLVIGDYDILKNQPKRYVSSGVGDMLSKFSALPDWRLSFWLAGEPYSDFAMNIAKSMTELLCKRIADVGAMNYIGIETLFLAEVTDGYLMELSGTTRVAGGSEHLFAMAMERLSSEGLHGEYCALGTIIMVYLQRGESDDVKRLLRLAGTPTTALELGIERGKIVKALTIAHKMRDWYTVLGTKGLSEGAAERIVRYTGVA
jgi:glycerol-1-phosphate dehydrogenase [NAD(P)+]